MNTYARTISALFFAVCALVPSHATAAGQDLGNCPDGYETTFNPDGSPSCAPTGNYGSDDSAQYLPQVWAAHVLSSDGKGYYAHSNTHESGAARNAMSACKKDVKARRVKAKCTLHFTFDSGYAAFADGDTAHDVVMVSRNQYRAKQAALEKCREKTTNCVSTWYFSNQGEAGEFPEAP